VVVDDVEDEQPEYKVETQSYSQHHAQKITHFTEIFRRSLPRSWMTSCQVQALRVQATTSTLKLCFTM
jgi:hypothetical protein